MIVIVNDVSVQACPYDVIRLVASAARIDDVDIEADYRGRVTVSSSAGSVSGSNDEEACNQFIELALNASKRK